MNVQRKDLYYWIVMTLVLLSSYDDAQAAELIFEHGERTAFLASADNFSSATYSAVALRIGDPYFVEFIQAGWRGKEFDRFIGVGVGYKTQGKWFVEGVISAVHLAEDKLADQDGPWLALLTAGMGYRFDEDFSLTLRMRHISNGNTQANNAGRDFIVIGPSVTF